MTEKNTAAGTTSVEAQRETLDPETDAMVGEWLTLPDVAERFGVQVTRVRQLLRDNQLIAVRRGENNVLSVPAGFIVDDHTVKGLTGTLTLLKDAKFTDEEALRWLFTPDDSLPGTPVDALRENRGTEVRRRAQAEL
ncbi:Rv2175c family DNA-binding protein [Catenulispora subtropica]|uniref:Rv2175c family DNA-binding protein n=2 Tax=Catenulispora subtropica TaxID=450798 RepID=A0ABP5E8J1_9ACTN